MRARTRGFAAIALVSVGLSVPVTSAPQDAPAPRQRSVLFYLMDTCRNDRMGFDGYERKTTPFLEWLAEVAVYLMEEFLESTTHPYYGGLVDYGDRAEHCWNGDHENGNHISRLRYNTMYLPRILERISESAPEGADLTSWRY